MRRLLADELLRYLERQDPVAAAAHTAALVAQGLPLDQLVDEGLAPAMVEVGARWEAAEWSVVDEHRATTVAEAALSAAAAECEASESLGEVAVACVEGDWHSLGARMVAEVLTAHGWTVQFLGASHSTSLLLEHVRRRRPQAVLLSCAFPTALPALVLAVRGIHEAGLPVYVGGGALGDGPGRAASMGADGWAAGAGEAVALLTQRPVRLDPPDLSPRLLEHAARRRLLPAWTRAAGDILAGAPGLQDVRPGARERLETDLLHLLEMANVSLLLEDATLLEEQCAWLDRLAGSREPAEDVVGPLVDALCRAAPRGQHGRRLAERLGQARGGRQERHGGHTTGPRPPAVPAKGPHRPAVPAASRPPGAVVGSASEPARSAPG